MLRDSGALKGFAIEATDGTMGEVHDLYFDDAAWVVRYLVVVTGSWLAKRKVLVSPAAILEVEWGPRIMRVSLTTAQVRDGPGIDTEKPVSRQHEAQYVEYYSYPPYWEVGGPWGPGPNPNIGPMDTAHGWSGRPSLRARMERARAQAEQGPPGDPHLRSCEAVMQYDVAAKDGELGHAVELLIDCDTWDIQYLVLNTSHWGLGHLTLVAPEWIETVNWTEARIEIDLRRQMLKDAPPYDPTSPLDRARELELYEHYGRVGYWLSDRQRPSVSGPS